MGKENAVIFILCRNSDLQDIKNTLTNFEEMFNKKYGYPYVIVNDEEFTEDFKNTIKNVTSTEVTFGKLKSDEWEVPKWIDMDLANLKMKELENKQIIYGGSLSYRKMCRFYSGFFYRNDLVKKFDYYWRIEPGVKFLCKINYDPFKFMKKNDKDYGFVITLHEFMDTIPTLFSQTAGFIKKYKNLIGNPKSSKFLLNSDDSYSGCHFWSNFEIGNFNVFRGDLYMKYFNWLDKAGGFFYERWGDAPVHTLAMILFFDKDRIHFFDDIGYEHPPFKHCPSSPSRLVDCKCKSEESVDNTPFSCLKRWKNSLLD